MKIATLRTGDGTTAAMLLDDRFHALDWPDAGALLASGMASTELRPGPVLCQSSEASYAPLILRPPKIFCVGVNYLAHLDELGMGRPAHPTLFSKFHTALAGANDTLAPCRISSAIDWEAELVVVVGRHVSGATRDEAAAAVAGFCVGNDISARDLQVRTTQWLAGKTLDASTPLGPWLVTVDETGVSPDLAISCSVNGVVMQEARTNDVLFDPVDLIVDISNFCMLEPGDIIFTGTPGGVGAARNPRLFLKPGDVVTTEIDGLGRCTNRIAQ